MIVLGGLFAWVGLVYIFNPEQYQPDPKQTVIQISPESESELEPEPKKVNFAEFCATSIEQRMENLNLQWQWDGTKANIFLNPELLNHGLQQFAEDKILVTRANGSIERWQYVCNNNPDNPRGPVLVRVNPVGDPFFDWPELDVNAVSPILFQAAEDMAHFVEETSSILESLASRSAAEHTLVTLSTLNDRTNIAWNHCLSIESTMGNIEYELSELSQTSHIKELIVSANAMEVAAQACIETSQELHQKMLGIAIQLGGSLELSVLNKEFFPEAPFK